MFRFIILCSFLIQYAFCSPPQVTPIAGTQAYQPGLTDTIWWSNADESAYYTDYLASGNNPSIFRYSPGANTTNGAYIPGYEIISYLVPATNANYPTNKNLFLVGSGHSNVLISWDGYAAAAEVLEVLFLIEEDDSNSHMDAGAQGPDGQFFVGTTQDAYCGADTAEGALYTWVDGAVQLVIGGLMATTGVAFGLNGEIYHCDVCTSKIRKITKNSAGEYVASVIFDFNDVDEGYQYPGYVTADSAGKLYIPLYGNGTFWQIDPSTSVGKIIAKLPVTATAAGFGGNDLGTIYAVVSGLNINPVTLNVTGVFVDKALYSITGVEGATGTDYPKANV